jgi:hypothetical protein
MHSIRELDREWEKLHQQWRDEQALYFEKSLLRSLLVPMQNIERSYQKFLDVLNQN